MGKLRNDVRLAWHSLFYGLKAADSVMQSQTSGEDGVEINEQVKPSGPFADMLQNKVTKEVEEMRDKMYRVYREAEKLKPEIELTQDEKTGELTFKVKDVKKKTKEDFMKHSEVFEKEGFRLRTIQEVRHVAKHSSFVAEIPKGIYDYDTNLTIERDFIPRFEIEKFAKRVVVREKEGSTDGRAEVDLYVPAEASQFGKIDAILISNLHRMMDEKNYRSDITDIKSIQWYSEHAWNCEDMLEFEFDDIKLSDIRIFDGSFVLIFDCNVVKNGVDVVEKYKTEELSEKYRVVAPKELPELMATKRRADKDSNSEIDLDNLNETTIKL